MAFHPDFYRVALAVNSRSELPTDPDATSEPGPNGRQRSVSGAIHYQPSPPVLADGLFMHAAPFDKEQEADVEIPNISCTKCTGLAPNGALRLAWIVIGLGSVFSILPALFLFSRRYGVADLGLRLQGITTALPVLAIFVGFTFAFSRHSITWSGAVAEAGSPLGFVLTATSACLPEEFFRFAWQTRISAWMKNPAAGWLIASMAWALLHGPIDYSQSHSIVEAVLGVIGVIDIVPLGLLWGYLTHRTGSFVPSMLLHGVNLWGLQNL